MLGFGSHVRFLRVNLFTPMSNYAFGRIEIKLVPGNRLSPRITMETNLNMVKRQVETLAARETDTSSHA
jgi:hypothetical protein